MCVCEREEEVLETCAAYMESRATGECCCFDASKSA